MANRTVIGSEVNDSRKIELDNLNAGTKVAMPVTVYDNNGNQISMSSGLITKPFDYISRVLNSDGITEVYTYKSGGASGTVVATVTVVYTDSSLNTVSTVTKV